MANLAAAIPDREVPVRVLLALLHCTNAILVGLFAYRLVPSPLAALFAVLFFLVPVPAHESLLWLVAAGVSTLGAMMFLIALQVLWRALEGGRWWVAQALVGGVCLVLGLATYEQAAVGIGLIPFLALVIVWGQEGPQRRGTILRAALLTVGGLVVAWLYWFLLLSRAQVIGDRGGLEVNFYKLLTSRIPKVFHEAQLLTLGEWGLGGMWQCLALLGIRQIAQAPVELCLLGALICVLIGLVASSSRAVVGDSPSPPVARHSTGLFGIGIVLVVAAFIPAVVIRGQGVAPRMLYFPWIGFTLAVTATLEYLVRMLTRRTWWPGRAVILGVGLVYLAGVLTLRGFAHLYHLRSEHDQRQIAALVRAVPSLPPDTKVVLLPVQLDEYAVRFVTGTESPADKLLYGVFEHQWSAAPAMQMVYRRPNIEAVASHHWTHLCFSAVHSLPNGDTDQVVVNGSQVATNQLLAFTYEPDRVLLINPLILVDADGTEISVALPLVERVRTAAAVVTSMRLKLAPRPEACR